MHDMKNRVRAAILCAAALLLLSACSSSKGPAASATPTPVPVPVPTAEPAPSEQPAPSESPLVTEEPAASEEPTVTDEPIPSEEPPEVTDAPVYDLYEFGTPLAECEPVEDSRFDSAAFLGDSRTEGFQLFGGLKHGDFYWARGMTVFRVDDPQYAIFPVGEGKGTMMGALRSKHYDAVYVMIGVNELGYPASSYEDGMRKLVEQVQEAQPDAVLYLQLLPPVNEGVAAQNGLASYINNTNINAFNAAIVRIAGEKKAVLLNVPEAYRDENGQLPADLASDGCHFVSTGYARWADYLRSHVMDAETYHYNRSLAETETEAAP